MNIKDIIKTIIPLDILKIIYYAILHAFGSKQKIAKHQAKRMCSFDYEKCNHCSICVKVCPSCALKLVDKKYIFNEKVCAYCFLCERNCPIKALKFCDK